MIKIIVLLFIFSVSGLTQNKDILKINITKTNGSHSFSLIISKRLFSPKLHDLSEVRFSILDNNTAFGIERNIPNYELDTNSLHIDNANIRLSKNFYKNFLPE